MNWFRPAGDARYQGDMRREDRMERNDEEGLTDAQKKLKDHVMNGLFHELVEADTAKNLVVTIGDHSERINAKGFGGLFGALQVAFSDRQTLSIMKLFDFDRNCKTRSIYATLRHMKKEASGLPIRSRDRLRPLLIDFKVDAAEIDSKGDTELTVELATRYTSKTPHIDRDRGLSKLYRARNAKIAHNEAVTETDTLRQLPSWKEAEDLVSFARRFTVTIAAAYLGLDPHLGNVYGMLDQVPRFLSIDMERLLKEAGITENREKPG